MHNRVNLMKQSQRLGRRLAIAPENSLAKKTLEDILNRGRIVVETESPLDKKAASLLR